MPSPSAELASATRDAALARLAAFLPRAGRAYADDRNRDGGPDERANVSTLSPYVRHRVLTEHGLIAAAIERHGPHAAAKFIQEVFWRTYWKGWLETHPSAWRRYEGGRAAAETACAHDGDLDARRRRALAGETGIAPFDAWARELVTTGYLHNHARMWFASIWIFTLRLPWELGAAFFLRHLLDGDPASNTLSWRWVAGLHTRGKTYLARRDNIVRYTGGRLDPGTALARAAEPLQDPPIPLVPLPDLATLLPGGGPDLLLLHDDDLGIDTLGRAAFAPRAVCALTARAGDAAPPAAAFTHALAGDALARAARSGLAAGAVLAAGDADAVAETLAATAAEHGCRRVVAPYAPVGPAADALAGLRAPLARRGLPLLLLARRYDALAWPHATRGFFALRERIPRILAELGLAD